MSEKRVVLPPGTQPPGHDPKDPVRDAYHPTYNEAYSRILYQPKSRKPREPEEEKAPTVAQKESRPKRAGSQNAKRRARLIARDGWACCWCGEICTPETATIEHLTPRSLGGGNGMENLRIACHPCNTRRGSAYWIPLPPKPPKPSDP